MLRSLELNWIRKEDKSLVMPLIIFSNTEDYSGKYFDIDRNTELLVDGTLYSLNKGAICISMHHNKTDRDIASVIAHEWRHHYQLCHGIEYDSTDYKNCEFFEEKLIVWISSKAEMDAWKFQCKWYKPSYFDKWDEIIRKHYEK